jgi:Ca2+-binding RTX toxin-like protein
MPRSSATVVRGTDGADRIRLTGTPGDDSLFGGTGIGHIDGRGGNDLILRDGGS